MNSKVIKLIQGQPEFDVFNPKNPTHETNKKKMFQVKQEIKLELKIIIDENLSVFFTSRLVDFLQKFNTSESFIWHFNWQMLSFIIANLEISMTEQKKNNRFQENFSEDCTIIF